VFITKEQLEALGDDEPALINSRFSRFHYSHLNRHRDGGLKDGCYGCGDLDYFIAYCPKKSMHSSDKYNSSKRKYKHEYTSSKHKPKGGFDKEAFKKKYLKKVKAQERAFLAFLNDLDNDIDDDQSSSPSSDDESERKRENKLTELCFVADFTHGGFCTMAADEKVKASKDVLPGDNDTTEVKPTVDALIAKLAIMTDTLVCQDKLLKRVARKRKELKDKLEITQKELEEAKKLAAVVSDEVECDECAVHMSNLNYLQTKYVDLLDENDELKSRCSLLGVCKSCSSLQSKLAEKNAKIPALEKNNSDSTSVAKCARCESLVLELEFCRYDKMRTRGRQHTPSVHLELSVFQ
jgi:hypothetical protein